MKKIFISFVIAATLMAASPAAFAGTWESPPLVDGAFVVSDLIIVRPLSVLYSAVAAIAWPFAAAVQASTGNDIEAVTEALIYEPFRFTVERPLGKFNR